MAAVTALALHRRCCSPAQVWGSSGAIASPGMAGAPRSVPLYPAAKVRTRSKGEANRVAKISKAHRASGVALCTTAEGKPKRPGRRVFGFASCVAAQSERHVVVFIRRDPCRHGQLNTTPAGVELQLTDRHTECLPRRQCLQCLQCLQRLRICSFNFLHRHVFQR